MKTDEHDGEDDPTVLVDVAAPHAEDPGRGLSRREGGQGKLNRLRMPVPDVVMISGESVVSSSDGAGHHTAGVELELGLKFSNFIFLVWKGRLILCNFLDQRKHQTLLMQRTFEAQPGCAWSELFARLSDVINLSSPAPPVSTCLYCRD